MVNVSVFLDGLVKIAQLKYVLTVVQVMEHVIILPILVNVTRVGKKRIVLNLPVQMIVIV